MTKNSNIDLSKNDTDMLRDGIHYTGNKGPTFGVRNVQVGIVAIGLGIALAYRISFSIAIIAMTDNTTSSNTDAPTYDWTNKSIILSAIFWGMICLPLISGYLGKQYGPKWFIFGAGLCDSTAFILIPFMAKYCGSTGVIICRFIQGLAQGMLFPMNFCVLGKWAPAEERSTMGVFGSVAVTLAIIISSIATGYIPETSLGWPWIFYIFGIVGLTWCVAFLLLAKQSPETHPSITPEEKKYIQVSLDHKIGEDVPTPWVKMFTSIHVWAILVAQIGSAWITIILSSEMSIFLNKVMEYGVKSNGLVSAIPPLSGLCSGIFIASLSDYIIRKNILSPINSRRLFQTIGVVGGSLSLLLMTFVPVKYAGLAVMLLSMTNVFVLITMLGASDVNALDISPMFAGIIFGCYTTISQAISFAAPLIIQWIVKDESDATQWRTVFIITAVITITTTTFFDIFASATRQNWDEEDEKDAKIMRARKRGSIISINGAVVS